MTLHKLTAGDGYTYLTRQVAAGDVTHRGYDSLGAYYAEKGESPGVWMGSGCHGLPQFLGGRVTEDQMRALFGEGRHPDAVRIEAELRAQGRATLAILAETRLGTPFVLHDSVNEFRTRTAEAFAEHNAAMGLPRDWAVPAEERAAIRTEVARDLFAKEYGREAADPRELSGFLARASRQATTAVAGYDLTFSPVKSVSALWALAPRDVGEVIEKAHADAVKDTLSWLEDTATYTRTGRAGVQQIEVHGLIAAAFTHRDSRAGDPDLHTHVAISNKVQTQTGRWLALDGRPMHKMTVAASERYNTRIETLLRQRLGVRFEARQDGDPAKRPVREIAGVDATVTARWSQRRAQIDTRRAQLAADFQATHHRPPTTVEALALAQQANLETRRGKHAPRSHAEQRSTWRAEAETTLGGRDRLQAMLGQLLGRHAHPAATLTPEWAEQAADDVLATVQTGRATWQECHVRAETERFVRAADIRPDQVDQAVEAIVTTALGPDRSIPLSTPEPVREPALLRRSDGTSVYETAGMQLYTSEQILADEQRLLAHARARDGRVVADTAVDVALIESAANGVELNPGQVQLVRELARSGARLQLALAPAGTGKTTAMRVLASAWHAPDENGTAGHVVGLAPSAAAAAVLRKELGVHTDTLAKLIHTLDHPEQGVPDWVHAIGPQTLVIVDEAGMAGTSDLARAADYIAERGGGVRLIGDDQQLAAIGAGGVLRDIANQVGAVHLSQVMRFADPAEGAASLALRAGDPAAIGYYIDNQRVHVGDETTVTDTAYTAWATERAAGRDSVMIAPTRDLVATLNARARADRLAGTPSAAPGREAQLADGSRASTGDVIITRNNDRRLVITSTDFVKNGDRWTITDVAANGSVTAQHQGTHRYVRLPAGYVAEHVALGYAATVHAAQGITADTSHLVATGEESRQLLYVAMTRGRVGNHIYLTTAGDGDPHSIITRDALIPPTAVDIMTRILARDGSQISATSTARDLDATTTRLRAAAARYHDALHVAAETHLGADGLAQLAATAETVVPGVTAAESWPALRSHLALLSLDGADPEPALREALAQRELGSSRDVAAVLDWRLNPTRRRGHTGPLPWLPAVPHSLADDPTWGTYLTRRADLVTELAETAHADAAAWTPTTAPAWATGLLDNDPALLRELAVWRAAAGVDDADRDPAGSRPQPAAEARQYQQLNDRVHAALGRPDGATGRFAALVDAIDPRITSDPYWPQLAGRLDAARRAGISIADLLGTVTDTSAGDAPLPDEYPAAALWWRISRQLSPAALSGDSATVTTLRPAWTDDLHCILGEHAADRVVQDPAWPALVAAVTTAREHGWQPDQVLATAYELLETGHPADEHLREGELATALVWRVGMLIDGPHDDTAQFDPEAPVEPPIAEAELTPENLDPSSPAGLHRYANSDPREDDDWLASLVRLDPAPEDELALPEPAYTVAAPVPEPAVWVAADAESGLNADALYSYPARSGVLRERLLELNTQAHAFYTGQYDQSWAPAYLADRLGTDLAERARAAYAPGYAPQRWTALVDNLRRIGADDTELLAAGLAVRASTGRLIDRFRDRLVMPIWHQDELHGFVGRRNPTKTDVDNAGPKYLNTAETDLYRKGAQLYGLHEGRDLLAAGATPVLVEGPLDAWAVTLAGGGRFVGTAPLGTAFTGEQADTLRPYIGAAKPGVLVATDNDPAGRKAAQRAFWQLAGRGDAPHHLSLPAGLDPADVLRTSGPEPLRVALEDAGSLARVLVDEYIDRFAGRLDTVEGRVAAARASAEIVGALQPDHWLSHIEHIQARLHLAPGNVHLEVIDAGHAWGQDPFATAKRHLAQYTPDATAAVRWVELGRGIRPDLIDGRDWEALAEALDRAHAAGYDVTGRLPELAAAEALPYRDPARDLHARLVADCDAAQLPVDANTVRIDRSSSTRRAQERMYAEDVLADNNRGASTTSLDQPRPTVRPAVPARYADDLRLHQYPTPIGPRRPPR